MTPFPRLTRRAIAATLLGSLLGATLVATVAAPAGAHTPSVSATCSTLSVSLRSYQSSDSNPKPNKVVVSIDGASAASEWFGTSYTRDFSFGDAARAHTWRVAIDAVDSGYDRTFEGTSTPCAPPTPKDAAAALHATAAGCTTPASLVLDGITNATWSVPTRTQGPGDYSVTATATRGHLFDDGTSSRSFTGTLAGALGSTAPGCQTQTNPTPPKPPTPTPPRVTPVPPKPAPTSISTRTVTVACEDGMITTRTTTTQTDWVLNAAGTAWVPAEPVATSTTSTRRAAPGDCPAVGGGGGTGGGTGPTTPTPGVSDGGGTGGGASDGGGAGGMVGGIFGIGVGASLGAGIDALAHSGADAMSAIFLAISLLAAGGIVLLRRRQTDAASATPADDAVSLTD